MEKVRGFEVAKGFEDKGINLPIRKIYKKRRRKNGKNKRI